MALFKMQTGDSSRLEAQEFHAGWGYLTFDDGQLFFDVESEDGQKKRIHINDLLGLSIVSGQIAQTVTT